jgi:glycosyltransferase involved in cell wall biosynthesis
MKKVIVFSGINITSGGPLTILRNVIAFANQRLCMEYEVYALVKTKNVLGSEVANIKVIEFPDAQRTFFHKLYYEYFYFRKLSARLNVFLWMSLNDCTPSVVANVRCVYIHNATSVYQFSPLDFRFPSRVLFQKFYYRFFLRANLNKNDVVVVQQKWLADFVVDTLGYKRIDSVLLHRPEFSPAGLRSGDKEDAEGKFFIYPTKPEVYKNIHTLIDAFNRVQVKTGLEWALVLTIDGTENRYARYLKAKVGSNKAIIFAGAMSFDEVMSKLGSSQALVFPSKLETWGLPLSEARSLGKFVLASDMPYARETLSGYNQVLYFDPDSALELAMCMQRVIDGSVTYLNDDLKEKSETPSGLNTLFQKILC